MREAQAEAQAQGKHKVSLVKKPLDSDSSKRNANSNKPSNYHGPKVSLKRVTGERLRELLDSKLSAAATEYTQHSEREEGKGSLESEPKVAVTDETTAAEPTTTTTTISTVSTESSVPTSNQTADPALCATDDAQAKAQIQGQVQTQDQAQDADAKAVDKAQTKQPKLSKPTNDEQADDAQANADRAGNAGSAGRSDNSANVSNVSNVSNASNAAKAAHADASIVSDGEQDFASGHTEQRTAKQNVTERDKPERGLYKKWRDVSIVIIYFLFILTFIFEFGTSAQDCVDLYAHRRWAYEADKQYSEINAWPDTLSSRQDNTGSYNPAVEANSDLNTNSNANSYTALNEFPDVNAVATNANVTNANANTAKPGSAMPMAGDNAHDNAQVGIAEGNTNEERFAPIEPVPSSKINEMIKFNLLEIFDKLKNNQQLSPMDIAGWKFTEHKKRVEDFYQQIGIVFAFVQNDELSIEKIQQALNSQKKPVFSLTADELNRLQQALMDGPEAIMQLPFGSWTPASSKLWCRVVNSELGTAESQENVIFPTPYHRVKANRWIDWYNHKCVGQSKTNDELALLSPGRVDSLLMRLTALLKMSLMPHTAQVYPYSAKPGRAEVSRVQLLMNQFNLNVGQPDGIAGAKTKKQISKLKEITCI